MTKIDTKNARKKLPARREPYWHKLGKGQHLGARKLGDGSCSWVARYTDENRKRQYEALGTDTDLSFEEATDKAQQFFKTMKAGASRGYTVADAVGDYINHLEINNSADAARRTRLGLNRHLPLPLLNTKVSNLSTSQIKRWLNGKVRLDGSEDDTRKSKDSINRILSMFKAALNLAFRDGLASDDTAWRRIKPFEKVGANRELFLTDQEVRRLLGHTSGGFHDLLEVAVLTGARYGELIAAKVADFDPHEGTLRLDGKTGARTVYLSDQAVSVIKRVTADKLPKAYLLARDDGDPWGPSHQYRPMREAVRAARLPAETVFYSLRHYTISKSLKAGIPAQVVAENTGTSIRMLELHYGKFMRSDRRAMMNEVELG